MKRVLILALLVFLLSSASFAATIEVFDYNTNSRIGNVHLVVNGEVYVTSAHAPTTIPDAGSVYISKLPHGYNAFSNVYNITSSMRLYANRANGITVQKLDELTRQPIQNIKLSLLNHNKVLIQEATTDNQGMVFFPTSFGTFYIREAKVPAAYEPDINDYKVNNYGSLTLTNKPIGGTLSVLAVAEDGTSIPNVQFGVYKDGKLLTRLTTKSNGWAIHQLPIGKYVVKQLTSKFGYAKPIDERAIIVNRNKNTSIGVVNARDDARISFSTSLPKQAVPNIKSKLEVKNITNHSKERLEDFYVEFVLPAKFEALNLKIGKFNLPANYDVYISHNDKEELFKSNVSSLVENTFSLGKKVDYVRLQWIDVPSGFTQLTTTDLDFTPRLATPAQYKIKTNVGGLLNEYIIETKLNNITIN